MDEALQLVIVLFIYILIHLFFIPQIGASEGIRHAHKPIPCKPVPPQKI